MLVQKTFSSLNFPLFLAFQPLIFKQTVNQNSTHSNGTNRNELLQQTLQLSKNDLQETKLCERSSENFLLGKYINISTYYHELGFMTCVEKCSCQKINLQKLD